MNISFKNPIKIISHDGYWGAKHKLEGIERAIELGVWGIEEDVFERNGQLYLGEEWTEENHLLKDALKFKKPIFIDLSAGTVDIDNLQYVITKADAEDYAIIQTASKDYLGSIDKKYKVAWNTFDVQGETTDFYNITPKIKYYTLNPAWYITKEKKAEIEKTGAKIIPVCLTYGTPQADAFRYPYTVLQGFEYIMVDYVEDFINFCKEYEIPI